MFDKGRVLEIRGWLDPAEGEWLYNMAKTMDSIIEIGSWCGRSTYCLLEGCPGTVYAVDTFAGSPQEPEWQAYARDAKVYNQFISNVGHYPNLQVFKMTSKEAVKQLPIVDMVFIDGSHADPDVSLDIDWYSYKARKLLCGHDYTNPNWPGVKRAVDSRFPNAQSIGSIWYVDCGRR